MPIYEYRCEGCRHQLESIQGFSDVPLTECPECKEQKLKRLISNAAIHFKGSGWYITDYARKGKKGASDEQPAADAKTETKAETPAETKAETKSEKKTEAA